jgi:hypothetical protein
MRKGQEHKTNLERALCFERIVYYPAERYFCTIGEGQRREQSVPCVRMSAVEGMRLVVGPPPPPLHSTARRCRSPHFLAQKDLSQERKKQIKNTVVRGDSGQVTSEKRRPRTIPGTPRRPARRMLFACREARQDARQRAELPQDAPVHARQGNGSCSPPSQTFSLLESGRQKEVTTLGDHSPALWWVSLCYGFAIHCLAYLLRTRMNTGSVARGSPLCNYVTLFLYLIDSRLIHNWQS